MMKKFFYVMAIAMLMGGQMTVSAQAKDNKAKRQRPTQEQMMQMQTDQMVKALMLDDATATKFTPVYQNYLKDLRECRIMNRKPREKEEAAAPDATEPAPAPRQAMTDDEIAKMLKEQFAQSRKMLDIREKYYNEFSKILSQKQIMKIYQQEKINASKFQREFDRRKELKPGQKPAQGDRQRGNRHRD